MGLTDLFQQGQKATATDPNQTGDGLSQLFAQGAKGSQDGVSVVRSEPITDLDKAQRAFDAYARQFAVPQQKSIIPQGIGATVGSLSFERIANQATQNLPPRIGMPIRFGAGVLGAAFGGAGGKGYQQLTTGDIGTLKDVYGPKGQLGAAGTEALTEIGGRVAGGVIGRVLSGGFARGASEPGMARLSKKLQQAGRGTTGAGVSPSTRKLLQEGGAGLTQGQRGSKGFLGLERFIESSYLGGGKLKTIVNEANPEALRVMKKDIVDRYWNEAGGIVSKDDIANEVSEVLSKKMSGFKQSFTTKLLNGKGPMDPIVIGETVGAARTKVAKTNREIVSRAYGEVEELAKKSGIGSLEKGDFVALPNAFKAADKIKSRWANRGESAMKKQMLELADVILTGPQKTDFANADQGIRSQLLAEARKLDVAGTRTKNPTLNAALDSIQTAVRNDLDIALNKFDPAIGDALDAARGKARANIQFEELPFVRNLSKLVESESPEKLISAIFTNASPKRIDLANRALGKETVSELADTWLNRLVTDSMDDPKSIGLSMKKKLDKMGAPSLQKMFGQAKTDDIYAIAKLYEKEGAHFLESKAVQGAKNLIDTNPAIIANKIFQSDNAIGLRKWKASLGPKTYKRVFASWLDDTMKTKGKTLNSSIKGLGDKMLKEMFTDPKHLQDVLDIARLDEIIAKTSGGGSVLAPLLEASAIGGLIGSPIRSIQTGGATVLGALPITGALLTNKKAAQFLAKGLRNPRKFQFYVSKATAELARHGKAQATQSRIRGSKEPRYRGPSRNF